ncbi:Hpt domain-containing protein [Desulfovibrio inopinatus]|uniref:Hpt domain-containing protein n=1 Tax=Desulfovibrio inopinatus TaxID=102109 RepID=UPI000420C91B|nr:Hpt domain-containing protein [Desulfovibrio inopinatus]
MSSRLIDTIHLHFTQTLGLPESDVEELLTVAKQTLAEGLVGLESSFDHNDVTKVRYWAHSLKGNFQNLGLYELAQHTLTMENAAQAKDITAAAGMLMPVKTAIDHILNPETDSGTPVLPPEMT